MSKELLKKCENVLRDVDYLFDELNNEIHGLEKDLDDKQDEINKLKDEVSDLKTTIENHERRLV